MTLFALIVALVLEQIRPLPMRSAVDDAIARVCRRAMLAAARCGPSGARLIWLAVVGGITVATLFVHLLLFRLHPVLAFAFSAASLYCMLGFRREESLFAGVQRALADDDLDEACRRVSAWRGVDHSGAGSEEVARLAVEQSLLGAHRGIFGVIFWFVLLPGPVGAVLYRIGREMSELHDGHAEWPLTEFSQRAFGLLDAVPCRLTAIAFSVIGNFEDAMACWRTQATLWPDRCAGVVLASAGGALGLRLGMPAHEDGRIVERPELGLGSGVDVDRMPRAARLVWRVLVLYVMFLALLAIAGQVGG